MKLNLSLAAVLAAFLCRAAWAQAPVSVAVTDLAYTQRVAEYFAAGKSDVKSTLHAGNRIDTATVESSGTYLAGTHSYIEQRELTGFAADIRSVLLRSSSFRLIQGAAFDKGEPQITQAERAFNAVNSGKAEAPKRQPEVRDIIARIKKGEFNGADYVLFGTLTDIEFRDQFSPIQGTSTGSQIFGLDLVAEYSLINTKTYEIKASFSAQGSGSETKLVSNRGDVLPPNRPKVIRDASKSLAQEMYNQMSDQLGLRSLPVPPGSAGERDQRPSGESPSKSEVVRFR